MYRQIEVNSFHTSFQVIPYRASLLSNAFELRKWSSNEKSVASNLVDAKVLTFEESKLFFLSLSS